MIIDKQLVIGKNQPDVYHSFFREVHPGLYEAAKTRGFFEAPASTKFHGAFEGGLVKHSLAVLYWAQVLSQVWFDENSESLMSLESFQKDLTIAALYHDFCKADLYAVDFRNAKDENGHWQKVPFYKVREDQPALGHGGESLNRINKGGYEFVHPGWSHAVYWHMGSIGLDYANQQSYMNTCAIFPEVLLLHTADMKASLGYA